MQTTNFNGIPLSRLMLGTVQFGLPYGIANTKGQPSYRDVLDILMAAHEGGVNCLDTAPRYGDSEEVLGKALAELKIGDSVTVVTKVTHLADGLSVADADRLIEGSIHQSLRRLNLDSLPICLFHREENSCYAESLLKLKERGLVQHIGSSVIHPEPTQAFLETNQAEAFQIPANLLDHRFLRQGVLKNAHERGAAIFVRSAYLQGLLLMPEAEIPAELAALVPPRRRLEKLAADAGLAMAEMAARYVFGLEGVFCAVVGVDSVEQMKANVDLFSRGPLDDALMQEIEEQIEPLPDEVILPNHWSSRMPDVIPAGR